uniref:LITAF domain-containing protein n=1 Tax=Heterorhabditis bacteriophora TaxID=37862 RepID=A0A1I7XUH6_HETBA
MAKDTSMSSFAKSSASDQHHLSGSELLAGNQAGIAEIPQSPTFGTSKSKHENFAKDDVEKSQNEGIFLREPLPSIPKQPQSAPIVPLVTTTKAVVHCAACNQMDINDPTEDCRSSVPMPCARSDGGEILCLTKQTQMTNCVYYFSIS